MNTKILVTFLVLILVSPAMSQSDEIQEASISGPWSEELPQASIQLLKGEKPGVMLSSAFVLADPEDNYDDPTNLNWVVYSKAKEIYFYVNYTVLFNTKVRFHLMITGPEFFSYTGDWREIKYKTNHIWFLWGKKANILKTKGHYKLVIVAEQDGITGGSESVASCTFKVL